MADPPIRQSSQPATIPPYDQNNLPALRRAHVQRWLCGTSNSGCNSPSGFGTHQEGGIYEFIPHSQTGRVSHIEFAQATLAIRSDGYVVGRLDSDSGYNPGLVFLNMASKELEVPHIEKRHPGKGTGWTVGLYANNGEKIISNKWFVIAGPLTLAVYCARHPELCPLP